MYIIGIDPSYKQTGWCIIEAQHKIYDCDFIVVHSAGSIPLAKPKKEWENMKNLATLYYDLKDIVHNLIVEKKIGADNDTFYKIEYAIEIPPPLQRKGAQLLQQVVGVIKSALATKYVWQGAEYYPIQTKKTITGSGRAEKFQVEAAIYEKLTQCWEFKNYDESDACACAMTHWLKKSEKNG